MAFRYQLPEGVEVGNDQDLFFLLVEMDFLGVSKLEMDTFRMRLALDGIARGMTQEQYNNFIEFAAPLEGMTTNIKPKTYAQFRKDMWAFIEDKALERYLDRV